MSRAKRAIFLDRDGVLTESVVRDGKPFAPLSFDELRIYPDAARSVARFRQAGFLTICVTNQPDVERGTLPRDLAQAINDKVRSSLVLDDLFACYESSDASPLRKPNPGMLLAAAQKHGIDLAGSFMIGDRWKDVEAGRRAGCKTIHVERDYDEDWPVRPAHFSVPSLSAAADRILALETGEPWQRIVNRFKIKIFADGADLASILSLAKLPYIAGFTTNPTLMKKAGVTRYEAFAREVLAAVPCHPISFEVIADEFADMKRQASKIAGWGTNVYVKIPITNSRRESSLPLVKELVRERIKVNVTALLTLEQVRATGAALSGGPPAYVSVFAGRVADTGIDPLPLLTDSLRILAEYGNQELIWASPREVFNLIQGDQIGCDIITITHDLLKKVTLFGKDLADYSLETVQMFLADGMQAGLLP